MLGKAAADGEGGPAAAPSAACAGQGKGGIIDIAEPNTVIENGVDRAGDFGLFMSLELAHGKSLQYFAQTLARGTVAAKVMHRLVHQPLFGAGPVRRHHSVFPVQRREHSSSHETPP